MFAKLSLAFRAHASSPAGYIFGSLVGKSSRVAAPRMALSLSTNHTPAQNEDQVLIEETKNSRTVVLNRPRQLNAISYWMTGYLKKIYEQWEEDKEVHLVLVKGSGRAFSAGGDVAEVYHFGNEGRHDKSMHFFSQEYNVDYLVGTYKKSHVALIDGIVMGGGAGLSINGSFRVVTEKAVFAMPETGRPSFQRWFVFLWRLVLDRSPGSNNLGPAFLEGPVATTQARAPWHPTQSCLLRIPVPPFFFHVQYSSHFP